MLTLETVLTLIKEVTVLTVVMLVKTIIVMRIMTVNTKMTVVTDCDCLDSLILTKQHSQRFQVGATVCHCLTRFKVKIQLDHYYYDNGSYIDVHNFIWASSGLHPQYQR